MSQTNPFSFMLPFVDMFITATETQLEHSLRFKSLQSSHGSERTERAARRVLASVFPSGSSMADWEQREREGTPTLTAPHAVRAPNPPTHREPSQMANYVRSVWLGAWNMVGAPK